MWLTFAHEGLTCPAFCGLTGVFMKYQQLQVVVLISLLPLALPK